ncbi:MAG: RNA polymerase sigma factor [bacterium]|nr:RNA polymerase sigma factor [bacterium]
MKLNIESNCNNYQTHASNYMKSNFKEKLLIAKLKLKDKDAFAQIYDSYIEKIYRFIYFKVDNTAVAEDLTSQTFLKIWQQTLQGNIKVRDSLQALIYATARNTVIDFYRRNSLRRTTDLDSVAEIAQDTSLSDQIADRQQFGEIEEKLKQLKSEYQEIIVLHYINELSISEIAAVLNKNKGAIRVTLHRAIQALKQKKDE